jgi:penicillin-binding protein 1A
VQALVATETSFLKHSGIDGRRHCKPWNKWWSKYFNTATSQQLFHGEGSKFLPFIVQKVKEWIIAIRLERQYTKNEIL